MKTVQKYQKEYVVKSYEVDCHSFLRILSLMNFLQDIATENAEFLGLGLDACREHGVAWVGSNYLIRITRLPKLHENIRIITWPAEEKLWGAIRDFVVLDGTGTEIIKASSQWVLIDFSRRRPVMLKKYFPDYCCVSERAIVTDFPKINVENVVEKTKTFCVRYDDIDVNEHVNNAVYPVWASEGVCSDFRKKHFPAEIEICFKKEVLYGENVDVMTSLNDFESRHVIQCQSTKDELALCRIQWREITSV